MRMQVVSKPDESVIYKSYTGKLSTTMEARRSRLERMQTLPNIKLISPTSSSFKSVLDATPEVPTGDDAPSSTPQQRRRPGKTTSSLVKRMSEGRFFLTDRTPARRTTSPVCRRSPLLVTPTPTGGKADQLEPPEATGERGDDELRRELKDVDNDDVEASTSGECRSVEGAMRIDATSLLTD